MLTSLLKSAQVSAHQVQTILTLNESGAARTLGGRGQFSTQVLWGKLECTMKLCRVRTMQNSPMGSGTPVQRELQVYANIAPWPLLSL